MPTLRTGFGASLRYFFRVYEETLHLKMNLLSTNHYCNCCLTNAFTFRIVAYADDIFSVRGDVVILTNTNICFHHF